MPLTRNTETSDLEFSKFQWIPNSLKGSSETKGNYENKTSQFSNERLSLNSEEKLVGTGPDWITRTGDKDWFCTNLVLSEACL